MLTWRCTRSNFVTEKANPAMSGGERHMFAGNGHISRATAHSVRNHLTWGSVLPNEHQDAFALRLDLLTQPLQKIGGHLADRASLNEAQMHATTLGLKHSVTGQRFGIRIALVLAQFLQTEWLVFFAPTVQIGLTHAAPPHLILIADDPSIPLGQCNESVAPFFS